MNLEYCHQILDKSIYHLADFLYLQNVFVFKKLSYQQHYLQVSCVHCALTVHIIFRINVQHFAINVVHWNFIFWAYQALNFIDRL